MTQTPIVTSNEDALLNAADDFLMKHESFRDKAYQVKMQDGTLGNPTIGYGFEFYGDEQTRVKMGETMTKEEAKPLLCLLYTSPSPRDLSTSRMPSSA